MPEPTPAPQPPAEKTRAPRGLINQKLLDALDKAGLISLAATKPDYAPLLARRDITGEFLTDFQSDITACKARIGKAIDFTSDIRDATEAEAKAQAKLIASLKEVQAAAKQKYSRSAPAQMKDYYVGEKLDASRAALVQAADSVAEKFKTDTLPGIDAAKIANLKILRDAYIAANAAQSDAQSKASRERGSIEADVKSITDRRVQIQLAADAEWPASNSSSAPVRREFQLPPDRPFKG